jgi:hypothetical protein
MYFMNTRAALAPPIACIETIPEGILEGFVRDTDITKEECAKAAVLSVFSSAEATSHRSSLLLSTPVGRTVFIINLSLFLIIIIKNILI